MSKSQDIQAFSGSSLNNDSNDTLVIICYNSDEEKYFFLQYEAEEDIYDDEIACKLSIWRKSYISFLENKINGIEYEYE